LLSEDLKVARKEIQKDKILLRAITLLDLYQFKRTALKGVNN